MSKPTIYTYTGLRVDLSDLRPEQINIKDIVHALSLCNRFAGHTREPVSVAQHSVYASCLCSGPAALQALLHDASEAYLGDVTKWLKSTPEMAAYRRMEDTIQHAIYRRFGCREEDDAQVVQADKLLVRFEMGVSMIDGCTVGGLNPEREIDYPPLTDQEVLKVTSLFGGWSFWPWRQAEDTFLRRFHSLTENIYAHQDQERKHSVQRASEWDSYGPDPDLCAS